MLISQILAWLSVFLCLMEFLRFVARKSKVKALNKFFHNIHIPFGIFLLITGGLHGLISGNFPDATLADIDWGTVLFTLNWGTASYLCAILLGLTYVFRNMGRKKNAPATKQTEGKTRRHSMPQWMIAHRILTVLILTFLTFHIFDLGIHVQDHFGIRRKTPAPTFSPSLQTHGPTTTEAPPSNTSVSEIPTESQPSKSTPHTPKPTPSPTLTPQPITFSGAVLADGTYEGSADGRNGAITVSVTIFEGQLSDLQIIEHDENLNYFSRAEEIINTIFASQSLEVDTVTGATISSTGIKNAVYNALQPAVLEGNLVVS